MSLKFKLSRDEAQWRSAHIDGPVQQQIHFKLDRQQVFFEGWTRIEFSCSRKVSEIWLEYAGSAVKGINIDGQTTQINWDGSRIYLSELQEGSHCVEIFFKSEYSNRGVGIHHFHDQDNQSDYYYSNLCPYEAGRVFPCFDQPDLKAYFSLSLELPEQWIAISNSSQISEKIERGRKQLCFASTPPIATYLFALCFGDYQKIEGPTDQLRMNIYCRSEKLSHVNADYIFNLITNACLFYQQFFGTPFAFEKYDQVFVPDFNWGAMENVGCVVLREEMLFQSTPSTQQMFDRDNTLVHELAHMWFGNLVTMDWWDDLWLNEAFATLMAYICLDQIGHYQQSMMFFHQDVQLKAKEEDSFRSTHPVVVDCADTDQAFQNFDAITYLKGASVLRQLLYFVGEQRFCQGLKSFFEEFRFSNANLFKFLEAFNMDGLTEWSEQWLATIGYNSLSVKRSSDSLSVRQSAEKGLNYRKRCFLLQGLSLQQGGHVVWQKRIEMNEVEILVPIPQNPIDFWLVNAEDHDFVQINLDSESLENLSEGLHNLKGEALQLQISTSLFDMMENTQLTIQSYYAKTKQLMHANMQSFVGRACLNRIMPYLKCLELKEIKQEIFQVVKAELDKAKDEYRIFLFDKLLLLSESEEERLQLSQHYKSDLNEDQVLNLLVHLAVMQNEVGINALAELSSRGGHKARLKYLQAVVSHSRGIQREQFFEKFFTDKKMSLGEVSACMNGFFASGVETDLTDYACLYYRRLGEVEQNYDQNYLKRYFQHLFPDSYFEIGLSEIERLLQGNQRESVRRQLIQWQDFFIKRKKIYSYNKFLIDTKVG